MRIIIAETLVALFFGASIASLALAQDASPEQTQPPAPPKAAAPSEPAAESAVPKAAETQPEDGCKGLEEKPCRKNTNCYWIIPKDPGKDGQVPPPYCKKKGTPKAKPAAPSAPPSP